MKLQDWTQRPQYKLFRMAYRYYLRQGYDYKLAFGSAILATSDERYVWLMQNKRDEVKKLLKIYDENYKS